MNDLIYGRQNKDNIVSIEIKDDKAELFIQQPNGSIKSEFVPNRFWILSNEKITEDWHKLKGELYYKYGKQYTTRKSFEKARRQLKPFGVYSIFEPRESFMVHKGYTLFRGLTLTDISVLSFDIETTTLDPSKPEAKILLISNTYRNKDKIVKKLFAYDDFFDEGEMIDAWCNWVRKQDPSIMCGHNIFNFDLDYLNYRAYEFGTTLALGRNGSNLVVERYKDRSTFEIDGSMSISYDKKWVYGRQLVDTLFLAYKHDIAARKYISYGLKPIIESEGLISPNRTFYDASKIRHNYKDPVEWSKIKDYCCDDSDDSLKLFDLMAPPFFLMAQSVPKPLQVILWSRTGSPINSILCRSYLQNGHSLPKASKVEPYTGAISFGVPGIYRNMLKIDFSGLYPSIMRTYKVYDKEKDPDGNLLKLINFYAERSLEYKKLLKETGDKKYEDMRNAAKIFANSMYGFLGTTGLNFNYPEGAAFIAKTARDLLSTSIKWATDKDYDYWLTLFKEKTK